MVPNMKHKLMFEGKDVTEQMLKKLKHFDVKLDGLDDHIVEMESSHKLTAKLNNLFPYLAQVKTAEDSLVDIVENYNDNKTLLVEKLDHFVAKLQDDKLELQMVNFIDEATIPKDFKNYIRAQNHINICTPHSTVSEELYEFYFSMLMKILRIFSVQETALEIKGHVKNKTMEDDYKHLHQSKMNALNKWMTSLEKSFKDIKEEDLMSCVEVKEDKKTVKFKNVLQVFFEGEINQPCKPNAKPELRNRYNLNGCHGRIRNCTFLYSE